MADDIVTRLRCNPCDCDGTCYTCQAADEIERLRAELDAERSMADKLAFDFRRHLAWYGTKETHKSLAAHKEARRGAD